MNNKDQFETIAAIAAHFDGIYPSDRMSLIMDIEFTNKVIPLRLTDMLESLNNQDKYVDSVHHDIFGIYNHFNRQTKQMENCWSPRFSM